MTIQPVISALNEIRSAAGLPPLADYTVLEWWIELNSAAVRQLTNALPSPLPSELAKPEAVQQLTELAARAGMPQKAERWLTELGVDPLAQAATSVSALTALNLALAWRSAGETERAIPYFVHAALCSPSCAVVGGYSLTKTHRRTLLARLQKRNACWAEPTCPHAAHLLADPATPSDALRKLLSFASLGDSDRSLIEALAACGDLDHARDQLLTGETVDAELVVQTVETIEAVHRCFWVPGGLLPMLAATAASTIVTSNQQANTWETASAPLWREAEAMGLPSVSEFLAAWDQGMSLRSLYVEWYLLPGQGIAAETETRGIREFTLSALCGAMLLASPLAVSSSLAREKAPASGALKASTLGEVMAGKAVARSLPKVRSRGGSRVVGPPGLEQELDGIPSTPNQGKGGPRPR